MQQYNLDMGVDCNLMSIIMYKTLFLNTDINELNKSINKK